MKNYLIERTHTLAAMAGLYVRTMEQEPTTWIVETDFEEPVFVGSLPESYAWLRGYIRAIQEQELPDHGQRATAM